jgi:hypothetical protein
VVSLLLACLVLLVGSAQLAIASTGIELARAKASLQQIGDPIVSEPVLPVDTNGLPPAPPLFPSQQEGTVAMQSDFPLPAIGRTAGAAESADPVVQLEPGLASMPALLKTWEGTSATGIFPPDTDGQVGRDHYVQIVNTAGQGSQIRVWDKNGLQLYNFGFNSMWPASGSGSRCRQYGYGDPVVLYDQLADRWLLTQFTNPPSGPYNECIAVSKTGTPTNNPSDWWLYEFNVHSTKFNDYPKFGVWPDGYYMTANQFSGSLWSGAGVWVFNRTAMLTGAAASFIYFDLYNLNPNYGGLLPSNLMGKNLPPTGAPNYVMSVDMNWSGTTDVLHIFEVRTNWSNPPSSFITVLPDLVVAPFDWNFTNPGQDVPQPGTLVGLDGLADRLMMHLWYRNFGDHESLVVNHTVNVGGGVHGIRWYEIRDTTVDTTLADASIYQQGTYAPDSNHRWMGSLAMDRMGNMALGYSIASSTLYPSIRYAGRLAGDPLGSLSQAEAVIIAGSGSQTGTASGRGRWGDYSAMSVDPVDDCTFWYTQEYIQTTSFAGWQTRVAAFRFPNCNIGPTGSLIGSVTDSSSSLPISGATVQVTNGFTVTISTLSLANGSYTLTLPASTYTVTATVFGYLPGVAGGVAVISGTQTVQDFALTLAPLYQVEGHIRDSITSWPLYAQITVDNLPAGPFWSDPVTGYYNLSLPGDAAYTFHVGAFVQGYLPTSLAVGPLVSDTIQDFSLQVDTTTCQAPGYYMGGLAENFEGSFPPAGWQVLDNAGTGVIWKTCSATGESGNFTGGSGECTGASSDKAGPLKFNTELWSPVIDAAQLPTTTLRFLANYQNYNSFDTFDVDVSNNGGGTWTNALRWREDHGVFRATPGVQVTVDLAPYLSGSNNRIRWHYYDPRTGAWDWYVQIDQVHIGVGSCTPRTGGLVAGNVYDFFAGDPINGASVSNQAGFQATSAATPGDPAVADGFYTIFSPAGSQVFTATAPGGYIPDVAAINVLANNTVQHDFFLAAGLLNVNPVSLAETVAYANRITVPLTLTNQGKAPVSFDIIDLNLGYQLLGATQSTQVIIPGTTYWLKDHSIQKFFHRPPFVRPEIRFEVTQVHPSAGYINVLLLTPDTIPGGNISLITTTLQAFGDLNLSVWDTAQGDPSGSALAAYDVVIVGNDYRWSSVGMTATGVGNALADYLDGGGKVIDTLFTHDWAGWQLAGRYISGGYSPYTGSSSDFQLVPYHLGTVYQPSHPILQGVASITDNPLNGIGHQDVGLVSGANHLADWDDGQAFLAVKGSVVGVNQLWFHSSNWSGDMPALMHNIIRYLAVQDAGWLNEQPASGVISALSEQVVNITFNSADLSAGRKGRFKAELVVSNNTPYGALTIPVVMTVTVPYEEYLPWLGGG